MFDTYDIDDGWDLFSGTDCDSAIAVYHVSFEQVRANDDHAGWWSRQNSFTVAKKGKEYLIKINGSEGEGGFFALNWNVGRRTTTSPPHSCWTGPWAASTIKRTTPTWGRLTQAESTSASIRRRTCGSAGAHLKSHVHLEGRCRARRTPRAPDRTPGESLQDRRRSS